MPHLYCAGALQQRRAFTTPPKTAGASKRSSPPTALRGGSVFGEGGLALEPRDADGARIGAIRTGLDLWMAAAGLRAALQRTAARTASPWR